MRRRGGDPSFAFLHFFCWNVPNEKFDLSEMVRYLECGKCDFMSTSILHAHYLKTRPLRIGKIDPKLVEFFRTFFLSPE